MLEKALLALRSPTAWVRTGPPLQSPLSFYFLGQPEEVQGTWHPSKPDLSQDMRQGGWSSWPGAVSSGPRQQLACRQ